MPRAFGLDLFVHRTQPPDTPARPGWALVEVARLRAHMEDAYTLIGAGRYHDAKLALQAGRWGTPHPDVADSDTGRKAA